MKEWDSQKNYNMAIKDRKELAYRKQEIDLNGPNGNVFALMNIAHGWAKQIWGNEETKELKDYNDPIRNANKEVDDIDLIMEEFGAAIEEEMEKKEIAKDMGEYICNRMMESDYDNAVKVFDEYFGSICDLYR